MRSWKCLLITVMAFSLVSLVGCDSCGGEEDQPQPPGESSTAEEPAEPSTAEEPEAGDAPSDETTGAQAERPVAKPAPASDDAVAKPKAAPKTEADEPTDQPEAAPNLADATTSTDARAAAPEPTKGPDVATTPPAQPTSTPDAKGETPPVEAAKGAAATAPVAPPTKAQATAVEAKTEDATPAGSVGDRRQEREDRIAAIKERNDKRRKERLARLAERNPEMAEHLKRSMDAVVTPSAEDAPPGEAAAADDSKTGTAGGRAAPRTAEKPGEDAAGVKPPEGTGKATDRGRRAPPQPPRPSRPIARPETKAGGAPTEFLEISHLLTLEEVREVTGDPKLSLAGALSGIEIDPHYNNIYFAPPRRKNFGVALQVWREEVRREANKRFQRMRRQYPNAEDTNALTLKAFFSYWGDVMSLTFLNFKKRTLVSVSCSQDICTPEELFMLTMKVKDRL